MSHVWASIALQTPCARPSRVTPLLQLFHGYARCQRSHYTNASHFPPKDVFPERYLAKSTWRHNHHQLDVISSKSNFSTTIPLASARGKVARPSKYVPKSTPAILSGSGATPPPTAASHTEGLPLIKEDLLTWRDYDPEGGMPLPGGELSSFEIHRIMGDANVDADTGNYILSVMYWRRMSGALIDSGVTFPRSRGVTKDHAQRGLQYVRMLDPGFDELQAGQQWAEEETLRLQQELQDRSVELGIYKRELEDEPADEQQGTEYGRARTGQSALQTQREAKEAAWEKQQVEKAEQDILKNRSTLRSQRGPLELAGGVQPPVSLATTGVGGGLSISGPQTKAWLAPVERKAWVKYYEERAQILKTATVPTISILGRLGPSFLVMLGVLGLGVFLADNYTPPPKSARMFPDTPPAVATLSALTAALCTAFVLSRMPPFWRPLSKYFTIVPAYPYAVSLVGAAFRHDTVSHLTANLATLWIFGLFLHEDVGRGTFLSIFFTAGAAGGFASLAYNVLRKQWSSYIFGSSGCVVGVAAAACALTPNRRIRVFGYDLPIAAWVFLAVFASAEAIAAARGMKTGIDHAGHLGGLIAGTAGAMYLRQKMAREREAQQIQTGRMARREASTTRVGGESL